MVKPQKRLFLLLVEGLSDEAALGSIMKEYFKTADIQFVVVHGDITTDDYVSVENILTKIYQIIENQMQELKKRYRYTLKDVKQIIHIVDTDGTFVPEALVIEAQEVLEEKTKYSEDCIETNNKLNIVKRNAKKSGILFKLSRERKINRIPYRVYFNSCNLEHVLHGQLKNFTDEEKEELADEFAERYDGRVEEFISFISDPILNVQGTYQQTWNFIQKANHSLQRYSNMSLIFKDIV